MVRASRWPLRAAVLPLAVGAVLMGGDPARAHPFGDPQALEISAEGPVVEVRWRAAPDDLTALAIELEVVEGQRTFVYQDGALVPEESDPSDVEALVAAPELADYLLANVAVRVGSRDCRGELASAEGLAEDGARLRFTCPATVERADIAVSTLVDLHPAYRTLATGESGQRHVYTGDSASAEWTFETSTSAEDSAASDGGADDTGRDLGRSALVQISAVGGVLAAVTGGALWLRRRRRPPDRQAA